MLADKQLSKCRGRLPCPHPGSPACTASTQPLPVGDSRDGRSPAVRARPQLEAAARIGHRRPDAHPARGARRAAARRSAPAHGAGCRRTHQPDAAQQGRRPARGRRTGHARPPRSRTVAPTRSASPTPAGLSPRACATSAAWPSPNASPGLIRSRPRPCSPRSRRSRHWPISWPPTGRIDEHPHRRQPAGAGPAAAR